MSQSVRTQARSLVEIESLRYKCMGDEDAPVLPALGANGLRRSAPRSILIRSESGVAMSSILRRLPQSALP